MGVIPLYREVLNSSVFNLPGPDSSCNIFNEHSETFTGFCPDFLLESKKRQKDEPMGVWETQRIGNTTFTNYYKNTDEYIAAGVAGFFINLILLGGFIAFVPWAFSSLITAPGAQLAVLWVAILWATIGVYGNVNASGVRRWVTGILAAPIFLFVALLLLSDPLYEEKISGVTFWFTIIGVIVLGFFGSMSAPLFILFSVLGFLFGLLWYGIVILGAGIGSIWDTLLYARDSRKRRRLP